MLDITIEDDERVSPYVCYKCTRILSVYQVSIHRLYPLVLLETPLDFLFS